jgi:hypothetical protein
MPTGGQFAAKSHPESDLVVEPGWPGLAHVVERQAGGVTLHVWENEAGDCQDPPDGSPAVREFRPDGSLASEEHYRNGHLHDPDDGGPAIRSYHPDGSVSWSEHYRDGVITDAADGSPAVTMRSKSGELRLAARFVDGRRVP